jgi:hypothetical protein
MNIQNNHWKAFVLFTLLWFGILYFTGTLRSGFHFTDDHDLINLEKDISKTDISREANLFAKEIFSSKLRFRPFYMLHRRAAGAILGSDFFAWSIYTAIMAVLTSFFLFLFMRKLDFSILESLFFVFLTLLGEQAAVWWKLGANETLGTLMLSITLLFMAKGSDSQTCPTWKQKLYDILFILFAILTSWCKESFVLILPALVIWKIWLTCKHARLWNAVKKNSTIAIVLISVCLWESFHIYTSISMTKIRYSGVGGFNLGAFIDTAVKCIMSAGGWAIPVQFFLIGIVLYLNRKKFNISLLWGLILAGAITGPQILLYMQSGIYERYLLPGVMGITFLMILLMKYLRESSARGDRNAFRAEILVLLIMIVIIGNHLRITRYTAVGFAHEGQYTNAWLHSIKQHTSPQDLILVITEPSRYVETSHSLMVFLDSKMNLLNILFSTPELITNSDSDYKFWNGLNKYFFSQFKDFSLHNNEDINRFHTILIFPDLEKKFLPRLDTNLFIRYTNNGGFVSYYRR